LVWVGLVDLVVAQLPVQVDIGFCLYMTSTWAVFGLMKPYLVYRVLCADSQYWQGLIDDSLADRAMTLRPATATIRTVCCLSSSRAKLRFFPKFFVVVL
jgi:hypothetical protein